MAFGNRAHDYATPIAADALEGEADRRVTLPSPFPACLSAKTPIS
jgi:hypothetical protein